MNRENRAPTKLRTRLRGPMAWRVLLSICGAMSALLLAPSVAWPQTVQTGFDVNKHGFSFVNGGWKDICLTVVDGTKLRYQSSGPACFDGWGLCGGMSLESGERFRRGQTSIELAQEAAKPEIINAQMQTLDPGIVDKWLHWMASPDVGHTLDPNHSVAYRMKQDWQYQIKPRLDRKEPVVVGLVFAKHATLVSLREAGAIKDLTSQHQVLAIGYTLSGSTVDLHTYDPNRPKDVLHLKFVLGQPFATQQFQSGAGAIHPRVRGVMFVRGVAGTPVSPPVACPTGRFDTTGKYHNCTCAAGTTKDYDEITFKMFAECKGAKPAACPPGRFSTTGQYHNCTCPAGSTKDYEELTANAYAVCKGAPKATCPDGKFDTTGKWRGCVCPPGKKKDYDEWSLKKYAKCK